MIIEINQQYMRPVIFYENVLSAVIKYVPGKLKKIFVPPLMFRLVKPDFVVRVSS